MEIMNKALGYRRLSDKDQSNYSLEDQEDSIRNYCTMNKLDLIAMFTDNGQCSDTFDRADYRALEQFIKKHRGKFSYLIVKAHDRFSRNLPEALMKIQELQEKYKIKVLESSESVDLDPRDPDVYIQRAFKYLMANVELMNIRKRTRNGIRTAQLSGRYVNMAPFGYINKRDESDRGILIIDENKAHIVQWIFESYILKVPMPEIFRKAKQMGFTRTGHNAITNLLGNCTYAGLVKVNADLKNPEKLIKGLHQPIISEGVYWVVQEMLGNKRVQQSYPKDEFPMKGIIVCDCCGHPLRAAFSKGRNKRYLYYFCPIHRKTNLKGEQLHEVMDSLLNILSLDEDQLQFINKRSKEKLHELMKDTEKVYQLRAKQLGDLDKKLDKLEERLINEEIDISTFKKWKMNLSKQKSVLEEELNNLRKGSFESKWNHVSKVLPTMKNLKAYYDKATPHGRQKLLKVWFDGNLTFSDGRYRTGSVHQALRFNILKAKKLGLIDIDESSKNCSDFSLCTQRRSRTGTSEDIGV